MLEEIRSGRSRLQKARDEIDRNKDRSVKEISQAWGFATQSAFTQSFKKAFGVSPSQHRKGEL
ncbi:MAG: helix-turn-helix domain-containing protein [Agrobacterium tumefaciens]